MDILHIVGNKDLLEYTENLNYTTEFIGDKYFPKQKSKYLKVLMRSIMGNANIPVMAQFHSLDAEARIGERPNFKEIEFEKLPIREKLNISERILEAFGSNPTDEMKTDILRFIFADAWNLTSRLLTRMEVANMEVLATGKMTINENGINTVVDYQLPAENKITFTSWNDADHDIIGDLENLKDVVASKGYQITGALTSTSVIRYLKKNKALRSTFTNAGLIPTTDRILAAVNDAVGITFTVNDKQYKTSINGATKNFYPNDTITFFTSADSEVGVGALGYTPAEILGVQESERSYVTIMTDIKKDPVSLWTIADSLYVPLVRNIDGLFIANIIN